MSFLKKLLDGIEVKWVPISEVTLRTNNIKWRDITHSYRYIDLTSVDIDTKKIIETSVVSSNNAPSRAQKLIEKDDVIFATTRPTQMRYCLIDEEYDGEVASTGYCVLRAKKEVVLPKWILHLISSSEFKGYLEENQSGSAYPAISDAKLKEFKIPIPCPDNPKKSLEIQTEIVRILDTFSTMIAELTAELSARKKQYNYYRDQLLNFEIDEVEWKTLGEVCELITKGTTPKNFTNNGVAFIKTEAFDGAYINKNKLSFVDEITHNTFLKRSILKNNDILFTIAGATIGKCAIVTTDILPANTNQALAIIRLKDGVNKIFIFYLLKSKYMQNYIEISSKGSAQPNLNLQQLNEFKIPIPSIAKQNRIVSILDKFDTLTNSINDGLPREIKLRKQQYEYYRDVLLSFPKPEDVEA
ncbi:TPA: restriction endonuclease subunit S [Acinetobacter baumannii]|uniref:restriction endonuclease subunit S n=1 Tax=Acinetobacter baumannii TaxID=470 RepID=UPI0033328835|nr:restriction endonuclease subunit S [Acinetobacter baumannii]